MKLIRTCLLAGVVLLSGLATLSQDFDEGLPVLPPEALQKDFAVFRDSLQGLHPGLYRYRSERAVNNMFDDGRSELNRSMTIIDFYSILKRMVSGIQDGHTNCFLPNPVQGYVDSHVRGFPVHLIFLKASAYTACSFGGLPAGTEIVAVNGESVEAIRRKIFRLIRSDGSIQTKKYWEMNYGDSSFEWLYYLAYGDRKNFVVDFRKSSGEKGSVVWPACVLKNVSCAPPPFQEHPEFSFDVIKDSVGLFRIKAFEDLSPDSSFAMLLQKTFQLIKKKDVKTLIIDLRNNAGGVGVYGALLYSYLTTKPFSYYRSIESTTKKHGPDYNPALAVQQPAGIPFTGRLIILVNGKSFSTTTEFCAVVKSHSRAEFIGEETGGGYYGNTSGAQTIMTLPNSKIRVRIPFDKYTMSVKPSAYKDRGIIPDKILTQNIEEIILGKDIQLEYALEIAFTR